MTYKIQGQNPFQILSTNFSIGPSNEGYTLQISADGNDWSDLFSVGANTTRMVTGVASGSYYRMNGNNSEVTVNWRTQCNDGGSGGGSGAQGPQGPAGGGGDSAQTMTLINNAIANNNANLEDGDPIVGMAKQLYSPDGVTSEGAFTYRTTAGDEDVATGDAELRTLKGNSDYSDVSATYSASAVLMRGGEEVTGFTYDITTGDVQNWVAWDDIDFSTEQPQSVRCGVPDNDGNGSGQFDYYHYGFNGSTTAQFVPIRIWLNGTVNVWDSSHCSVVTENELYEWNYDDLTGTITIDWTEGLVTLSITGGTGYVSHFHTYNNDINVQGLILYENDLTDGETTYTYGVDSWSPELPLAISNMQVDGVSYAGTTDDELVITKSMTVTGSAKYPQPDAFVALGLNSFDYTCDGLLTTMFTEGYKYQYTSEDTDGYYVAQENSDWNSYAIRAVAGLSNGYVIHISGDSFTQKTAGVASTTDTPDADIDFGTTELVDGNLIVYPTTAMPYIVLSVEVAKVDKVCVHPRWSGKEDDGYEDYEESVVDLSSISQYPLYSVGNYRNEIDLKNGVFKEYVTTEPFDADNLQSYIDNDGYVLGSNIAYDEDYIYLGVAEPSETTIEVDYAYKDNDFSVEYFIENNDIIPQPVYAETYYVTNLVDKLRRMNGLVHLDNLDGTGNENTVYECDDRLWYWTNNSGVVAEWTDRMTDSNFGAYRGYGLIFSHIPNGQTLFEAKYIYDGDENYKSFKMSGSTLVMTDTGGTFLSACTVGETKDFKTRSNGSSSYLVKVKVEKHWIGFEIVGNHSLRNLWDGTVTGGHFGIVDHTNYPYMAISNDAGIARWNSKGQVIAKDTGYGTKNLYFNATGTSSNSRLTVLTNGTGNGPDHIFGPDNGGTAGQILTSNGNAAPVWSNWIKSVKITSDAYEALDPKDPNTLYLIVDE